MSLPGCPHNSQQRRKDARMWVFRHFENIAANTKSAKDDEERQQLQGKPGREGGEQKTEKTGIREENV